MKKLGLLFMAVVFTAFGSSVFAQDGSGVAPSIGSTHQYYVNGTYDTPTSGAETHTYTWWVSTDNTNLLTPTSSTTDFTVTDGSYNSGTVGQNGIELVWNPTSANNTYYLVVKENDGTCDNIKAITIEPVNNFTLSFLALDASGNYSDDPSRCAPDIAVSASGSTITYDYGTDEYLFKLISSGLYTSWSFDQAFVNSLGSAGSTIEYQVGGTGGTWTPITTTKINVDANVSGTEEVYIRVTLDNKNSGLGAGNFEEGLSGQTIQLTLSNVVDAGNLNAAVITNNAGSSDTNQTQTVNARPATTTIGTDN